jgi:uncharacterized protein
MHFWRQTTVDFHGPHRSSITRTVLVLCSVLAFSDVGHANSFDCAKASSDVERMICADARLSDLDEAVAEAYREARFESNDSGAQVLRDQQSRWLRERNTCREISCIAASYEARLRELPTGRSDAGEELESSKCAVARCTAFVEPGPGERLWNSASKGNLAGVRMALAEGALVDVCGSYGRPLDVAVSERHAAVVRELLSAKANPNVRNCAGNSPLTLAAFDNDVTIALLLLDARADIELGEPLLMAAFHGHVDILRLLLKKGANLNAVRHNSTALMIAAGQWEVAAVDILLQAGANPNWTTSGGGNALFDAVGAFRVEPLRADEQEEALPVIRLLVQHGANVNARTAGQSALQRARALKAPAIVEFLVASGAKD